MSQFEKINKEKNHEKKNQPKIVIPKRGLPREESAVDSRLTKMKDGKVLHQSKILLSSRAARDLH